MDDAAPSKSGFNFNLSIDVFKLEAECEKLFNFYWIVTILQPSSRNRLLLSDERQMPLWPLKIMRLSNRRHRFRRFIVRTSGWDRRVAGSKIGKPTRKRTKSVRNCGRIVRDIGRLKMNSRFEKRKDRTTRFGELNKASQVRCLAPDNIRPMFTEV